MCYNHTQKGSSKRWHSGKRDPKRHRAAKQSWGEL